MTILISIAVIVGMLNLVCLFSRHVARIVGSALLAHADGIDAYRSRTSKQAEHWFDKATEMRVQTGIGGDAETLH